MGLKEQLAEDLKTAMRAKDANRVGAIRMLKDAISKFEIARTDPSNKDASKPITARRGGEASQTAARID